MTFYYTDKEHFITNIVSQVDFDKLEVEDQALKKRKEEEQRRKQMINEERLRLLRNSMKGMKITNICMIHFRI